MKMRIVITETGQVALFSDTGTFAEGDKAIQQLFAALQAEGVDLTEITPTEQHRHDDQHAHTHTHNHN